MNHTIKILLITLLGFIIASCSTVQKNPDNKPVRLIQKNELSIILNGETPGCRYLGEIIGTEGYWYSYLFISNRRLVQSALNDLYNRANAKGANVVFISDNISFSTSVTFYGQAYHCNIDDQF
ncbi:MAG: DUF4156 domain-containing protein [Proteobacteria bacterium]|nr:DUF4156 domain-containing protein [Pseudomonadota bacterium]